MPVDRTLTDLVCGDLGLAAGHARPGSEAARGGASDPERLYVIAPLTPDYHGVPGCDIDQVEVVPRHTCTLGRLLQHRDGCALAAELLFGQPLQAGETWV